MAGQGGSHGLSLSGKSDFIAKQWFILFCLLTQEAEANGYTNYHEITTKESLDQVKYYRLARCDRCECQVRIVFAEGIRRGLASGEHVTRRQRLQRRQRTISVDNTVSEQSLNIGDRL